MLLSLINHCYIFAMITQIKTNSPLQNFSYLIEYQKGKFWCLDPYDAGQINGEIDKRGGQLEVIINSHEHWDHYQGNEQLLSRWQCELWAHPKALGIIPNVSRALKAAESIKMDENCSLEILDTPGHTFAHISLLIKEHEIPQSIFSGDTFFNAGVGNCRNGGDPKALFQTIKKYYETLPDQVLVYPGHDYLHNNLKFTLSLDKENESAKHLLEKPAKVMSMKDERNYNLFLRLQNESLKESLDLKSSSEEEIFIELRKRRDQW